ncbi:hypothetical protein K438DRAFT_1760458 [Mycena galopus ATCC 62051]|nr:hypothetical protein K438DRAFT_1760458 [Mycena galopus ATCC 62051]
MSAAEADAGCCGCCAICIYSALEPWCNTKAFGGGDSNHQAGCCGWCCNKSFNEDSMDKWDKAPQKENTQQPGPSEPMKMSAPETSATEPSPPAMKLPTAATQ